MSNRYSENDLVFTPTVRVVSLILGALLGLYLEQTGHIVSKAFALNQSANLLAFFGALFAFAGGLLGAAALGGAAAVKKVGVYTSTWYSTVGYLKDTFNFSMFGIAGCALAAGLSPEDLRALSVILALLGGAAVAQVSSALFALEVLSRVVFDRSEGPTPQPPQRTYSGLTPPEPQNGSGGNGNAAMPSVAEPAEQQPRR